LTRFNYFLDFGKKKYKVHQICLSTPVKKSISYSDCTVHTRKLSYFLCDAFVESSFCTIISYCLFCIIGKINYSLPVFPLSWQ